MLTAAYCSRLHLIREVHVESNWNSPTYPAVLFPYESLTFKMPLTEESGGILTDPANSIEIVIPPGSHEGFLTAHNDIKGRLYRSSAELPVPLPVSEWTGGDFFAYGVSIDRQPYETEAAAGKIYIGAYGVRREGEPLPKSLSVTYSLEGNYRTLIIKPDFGVTHLPVLMNPINAGGVELETGVYPYDFEITKRTNWEYMTGEAPSSIVSSEEARTTP